jgi:hypothetical protein
VLYFLLTGDMGDLRAAIEPPAMMRNGVTLLVGRLLYMLIPFILGYVVLSFVLAIVGEGYYHAKDQLTRSSPHGELPNMLVEAAALMRYRKGLRGSRHWKKLPLRAGARAKLTTEEREEKVYGAPCCYTCINCVWSSDCFQCALSLCSSEVSRAICLDENVWTVRIYDLFAYIYSDTMTAC